MIVGKVVKISDAPISDPIITPPSFLMFTQVLDHHENVMFVIHEQFATSYCALDNKSVRSLQRLLVIFYRSLKFGWSQFYYTRINYGISSSAVTQTIIVNPNGVQLFNEKSHQASKIACDASNKSRSILNLQFSIFLPEKELTVFENG